jgi:hypothetical protein
LLSPYFPLLLQIKITNFPLLRVSVQADIQVELMKKVCQWCDEANSICDAGEAAIVDSIVALPMWGANSSELVAALCSPDKNTPGTLLIRPFWNMSSDCLVGTYSSKGSLVVLQLIY